MATRFVDDAAAQLNPLYDQQQQAVQAQLPAIQNLYDTLVSGLEGQRQTETQNILESASQRGVLRSTLPVDLQTQLGAALLAQRGKLESQRASDVAGVNKSIADIGIQRTGAINSLADSLQQADLRERQFQMSQQQAQQDYQLKQQQLAAEVAARSAASAASSAPRGLINGIYATFNQKKGKDGFVSPQTFRSGMQQWTNAGGSPDSFLQAFGAYVNPVHQQRFGGYF